MTFSNIHQHDWRRKSLLPEIYLEKLIFTFGMTLPLRKLLQTHFDMIPTACQNLLVPHLISCIFQTVSPQNIRSFTYVLLYQKVRFLSSLPSPLTSSQAVCGMWFGFLPKDYSLWENKAPQCALFSTFLGPDISPTAGRTPLQYWTGCVREEAHPDLGSLAGGPWQSWGAPPSLTAQAPHNNAIKGMLYIPHVVLWHKLDGDR